MDDLSGAVERLRSENVSDDKILDGLKTMQPQDADALGRLQNDGAKSTDIINNYVKYRQANPDTSDNSNRITDRAVGIASGAAKAFAHGVGDELSRFADTGRYVLGANPTGLEAASRAANNIAGSDYDPGSNNLLSAGGLGRAVVKAVPSTSGLLTAGGAGGLAGSVVPGVGTVAGGLAGMGAYALARYWGRAAKERAENNGHTTPTNGDVWGALPSSTAQAAFDTVGGRYLGGSALLEKSLASGAGAEALKQTLGNFAKSGAVNAATSAASDLTGQIGSTAGTQHGLDVSPAEAAHAALAGGLVSSALKLQIGRAS